MTLWAFWTIKNEDREEWCACKLCTMKEQGTKLRVLTLSPMNSMEEPDRCINAYAETPKVGRIGLETVNNSNVSKRS